MRATISTAPTPFDSCTKEEIHDWLSNPVTEKLIASVKKHIDDIDGEIVNANQLSGTDEEFGRWFRRLLSQRDDRTMLLDWIQGANRA